MENQIISELRDYKLELELSESGYYENDNEEIELFFGAYSVVMVVNMNCEVDKVKAEFNYCINNEDEYVNFTKDQIELIEGIIENNTELSGGPSEDVNFYDPQAEGDTL